MIRKTLLLQKLANVYKDPQKLQTLMDKKQMKKNQAISANSDKNPYQNMGQPVKLNDSHNQSLNSRQSDKAKTQNKNNQLQNNNNDKMMFDLDELNSSLDSIQETRKNTSKAQDRFDLSIDITKENEFLQKEDAAFRVKQSQNVGNATKTIMSQLQRKKSLNNQSSPLRQNTLRKRDSNRRESSISQTSSQYQIRQIMKRSSTLKRNPSSQISQFTRGNQSIDEETESDVDLPQAQIIIKPELKNNEFLKMYQMKNSTHEADREKASCISENLQFNKRIKQQHPFFNRKQKVEPDINLAANDLFMMAQLTEQEFERLRGQKESDFKGLLHKERTMKISPEKVPVVSLQGHTISEKKQDAILRLKIANQLLQFKLKRQFGESNISLEQSQSDFQKLANLQMNKSLIQSNINGIRNLTTQAAKSRNHQLIQAKTVNSQQRPMTSFQLMSHAPIIEETPYIKKDSPKFVKQNQTTSNFKSNFDTSSFEKHSRFQHSQDFERQLLKTSYTNILQQVAQSNQLQLQKFHQQRIKEINKKLQGIQKYSIEDFLTFDKNFADKLAINTASIQNQKSRNSKLHNLTHQNKDNNNPFASTAYQFKSKEEIEREAMSKNRELQDRAIDKTTFFTKVSPNSFIKVYTTKYHLRENELLPFYTYEKDHKASLAKFKKELLRKQQANTRKFIKTQDMLNRSKQLSKDGDISKRGEVNQFSSPIKIVEMDRNQTPRINNQIIMNFDQSSKESLSPGRKQSLNNINNALTKNRFFTSHQQFRPRTNTDVNHPLALDKSKSSNMQNDDVSQYSRTKQSPYDAQTINTATFTNKHSNVSRLFNENNVLRDQILQQANDLNRSVNVKKSKSIFSNFTKLITEQKKLQKLVDDKLYDLDEARANYTEVKQLKMRGKGHLINYGQDNKQSKCEGGDEEDQEGVFEQYKQNFMRKVKVWNINELKKIDSDVQKQFYQSIK
eukprot:403343722